MIPSDMGTGVWDIYLAIADATDTLRNIPQYNILAVNQDSNMQNSGLNDLSQSIIITTSSPGITTTSTEGGVSTATDSQSITIISTAAESGIDTTAESASGVEALHVQFPSITLVLLSLSFI